jgi:5'-nucleotidase
VRFTRQSPKITRNVLQKGEDPRGRIYYWLNEQRITEDIAADTDHAAILAGEISVTPLVIDHTDAPSLNHLSHWRKLLEGK